MKPALVLDSSETVAVDTRAFGLRIVTTAREKHETKKMRGRAPGMVDGPMFEVDSGEHVRNVEQVHSLELTAPGQGGKVKLELAAHELALLIRTLQKAQSTDPYAGMFS